MSFDLSKLPNSIKLEITKGDLEAFAQTLLTQVLPVAAYAGPANEILTIDEAAEFTGLAKQTIYGLTSRRKIPHFKRGKGIRFRRTELEEWVLENRRETIAEITKETFKSRKP